MVRNISMRLSAVMVCGLIVAPLTASAQHGRGVDRLESLGASIEKNGARLYHEIRHQVHDRRTRGEMLADAQAVYHSGKRIQEFAHHGRMNSVHREVGAMERSLKRLDSHAHELGRHVVGYRHGDHLHAEPGHGSDARQIQRLVHDLDESRERIDDLLHRTDDRRAPPRRPAPVTGRQDGVRVGGPGFSIQFGR